MMGPRFGWFLHNPVTYSKPFALVANVTDPSVLSTSSKANNNLAFLKVHCQVMLMKLCNTSCSYEYIVHSSLPQCACCYGNSPMYGLLDKGPTLTVMAT